MDDTVQICVRLKKQYMDEIEKLSRKHELPKSYFVQQAVRNYLGHLLLDDKDK